MNIYQHLFILVPMLCLLVYGFSGYGTTNKLYCVLVGFSLGIGYFGYFFLSILMWVFNHLGTL